MILNLNLNYGKCLKKSFGSWLFKNKMDSIRNKPKSPKVNNNNNNMP